MQGYVAAVAFRITNDVDIEIYFIFHWWSSCSDYLEMQRFWWCFPCLCCPDKHNSMLDSGATTTIIARWGQYIITDNLSLMEFGYWRFPFIILLSLEILMIDGFTHIRIIFHLLYRKLPFPRNGSDESTGIMWLRVWAQIVSQWVH